MSEWVGRSPSRRIISIGALGKTCSFVRAGANPGEAIACGQLSQMPTQGIPSVDPYTGEKVFITKTDNGYTTEYPIKQPKDDTEYVFDTLKTEDNGIFFDKLDRRRFDENWLEVHVVEVLEKKLDKGDGNGGVDPNAMDVSRTSPICHPMDCIH